MEDCLTARTPSGRPGSSGTAEFPTSTIYCSRCSPVTTIILYWRGHYCVNSTYYWVHLSNGLRSFVIIMGGRNFVLALSDLERGDGEWENIQVRLCDVACFPLLWHGACVTRDHVCSKCCAMPSRPSSTSKHCTQLDWMPCKKSFRCETQSRIAIAVSSCAWLLMHVTAASFSQHQAHQIEQKADDATLRQQAAGLQQVAHAVNALNEHVMRLDV